MLSGLKRILFIAIIGIGLCEESAEGAAPVLDFNGILAGQVPSHFVPKIYGPTVPAPPGHIAPKICQKLVVYTSLFHEMR